MSARRKSKGKIPFRVGQRAEIARTLTEADVVAFAGLSGDYNPLHVNAEYAQTTRFGGRIAHGMLSGALLSAVLGMHLPGPGAIFLSCQMRFLKPTRIGDTITAAAEVTEIRDDKPIITLRVWCTNQQGETTVDGEAVCYYGG